MPLNTTWALEQLDEFLKLAELYRAPDPPGVSFITSRLSNRGSQEAIVASAHVVEKIFDRVLPGWRTNVSSERNGRVNRWAQHIETAQRVRIALQRDAEIRDKLGDNAPNLNANRMHPWIWDSAQSLWASGHYREAVAAAAVKLNAETQNKVGRRDISETDLFKQVFTLDQPQPGKARLRILPNDGSRTYENVHRGARALAEGCYAGLRNPVSHTVGDLEEHEALEQLAAFSILARWVDQASLETA